LIGTELRELEMQSTHPSPAIIQAGSQINWRYFHACCFPDTRGSHCRKKYFWLLESVQNRHVYALCNWPQYIRNLIQQVFGGSGK